MSDAKTTSTLLPGDVVLTEQDIAELGLEEAPDEAGPSIEEINAVRQGRHGHG